MTTYSFAQLEGLWIAAGGSKTLAPLMAGVAMVESGGNPDAENPSGATGLWQMEWPLYQNFVPGATSRDAYKNPQLNAAGAVKLSRNTMAGIQSNWLAFEPPGAAQAIARQHGGVAPQSVTGQRSLTGTSSAGGGGTSGGTGTSAAPTSSDLSNLLAPIRQLLHAVATVIDYSFTMFEPGQGFRVLFGLAAVVTAFLSYRVLASSGGSYG